MSSKVKRMLKSKSLKINNLFKSNYLKEVSFPINRTGLIYDPLMLDFHCEWDPQYPEVDFIFYF